MPKLRFSGGTKVVAELTILPWVEISPLCGCSRPAMQRKVVVLPHPLGPSNVTNSRGCTVNDTPATAEIVAVNTTVHGRMDTDKRADVDLYRVSGNAGRHLSVEIDSVWLTERHYAESEFDLTLRLLDSDGKELARNDDSALHLQDPIASVVLPRDGDYFVEIKQRVFKPGPRCYYLAHIGDQPRPLAAYPAGGRAGRWLRRTAHRDLAAGGTNSSGIGRRL